MLNLVFQVVAKQEIMEYGQVDQYAVAVVVKKYVVSYVQD
tara:strand:+ start:208 stop:327 length:120 start_codon:yes stop_codon:yes gene_type:complete